MEKERAEMEAKIEEDRQRHRDEVESRNRYLKEKDKAADAWILRWEAACIKEEAASTMRLQKTALKLEIHKIKKEAGELASSFQPAKKAKTA